MIVKNIYINQIKFKITLTPNGNSSLDSKLTINKTHIVDDCPKKYINQIKFKIILKL